MHVPGFSSLADLGEFFALPTAEAATWRPIRSLCGDPAVLREYTMRTRAATASGFGVDEADIPVKAAASSLHLAITARLLSPAVGAAVCLAWAANGHLLARAQARIEGETGSGKTGSE